MTTQNLTFAPELLKWCQKLGAEQGISLLSQEEKAEGNIARRPRKVSVCEFFELLDPTFGEMSSFLSASVPALASLSLWQRSTSWLHSPGWLELFWSRSQLYFIKSWTKHYQFRGWGFSSVAIAPAWQVKGHEFNPWCCQKKNFFLLHILVVTPKLFACLL